MLEVIVVVLEGRPGVVGRIDVDALHAPGVVGKQGLEGLEVVALDEEIVPRGLAVTDNAALGCGVGLEETEGNKGCGTEGVFFTGPSQGGYMALPFKTGAKLSCYYMSQGSGTGDMPRQLIPSYTY